MGLNEEKKRVTKCRLSSARKHLIRLFFIFTIIIITTITIIFLIKGASLKQDTKSVAKTNTVTEVKQRHFTQCAPKEYQRGYPHINKTENITDK